MRNYHHIDLSNQQIRTEELEGEAIVKAGRYLIAKTLNDAFGEDFIEVKK